MKRTRYGYKVCYIEKGHKRELKRYFITRTYKQALEMKKFYLRFNKNLRSREDYNHILKSPTWYILPITIKEIKQDIWRECPF